MAYFEQDDVLHLALSEEPEAGSVEVSPGVTMELNAQGELIGIEILRASLFVRDAVAKSARAKVPGLPRAVAEETVYGRRTAADKRAGCMADRVAETPASYGIGKR
jgi:uncharacterized protein YuzE